MGSQVASPLVDQSAYKSQKLQALCATKELKSLKIRKPFGGTRGLQVAKVVSPLGDQGAYKYHLGFCEFTVGPQWCTLGVL